jgi:hypothetical protein
MEYASVEGKTEIPKKDGVCAILRLQQVRASARMNHVCPTSFVTYSGKS